MKVILYEHLHALAFQGEPLADSLLQEGRAMLFALQEDAHQLQAECVRVCTSAAELSEAAPDFDWIVVIAPEIEGVLSHLVEQLQPHQHKILGPDRNATKLASDKLTLAQFWEQHRVPTPTTWAIDPQHWTPSPFAIVVKPRDGAGSQATEFIPPNGFPSEGLLSWKGELIAQPYYEGIPASVSFLCGPQGNFPLLPFRQVLSQEGYFHYLGGTVLEPELHPRAVAIASAALTPVSGLRGYVGVDLILGKADLAIEINPRLTTSYVGLRAISRKNLLEGMISVTRGEEWSPDWKPAQVTFEPNGFVQLREQFEF